MTDPAADPAAGPTPASTARVATERAARYGKQLVAHLTRRAEGAWDEQAGAGWIDFGESRTDLAAEPDALRIQVSASPERVANIEDGAG